MALMISLLLGSALVWASPLLESNHPSLRLAVAFLQALESMFGDAHQAPKRGQQSVADSAAKFYCLVADTEWNEVVQRFCFWLALTAAIKDGSRVDSPAALANFLSRCIHIDTRLTERDCKLLAVS